MDLNSIEAQIVAQKTQIEAELRDKTIELANTLSGEVRQRK
jgi:hypothetical protein